MRGWHKTAVALVPKTLGDHLKCKRLERNLSQKQVAAILGVRDTVVGFWEANFYTLPAERRERVIAFLGYDPEALQSASHHMMAQAIALMALWLEMQPQLSKMASANETNSVHRPVIEDFRV